jgi:hypothetical protein
MEDTIRNLFGNEEVPKEKNAVTSGNVHPVEV